MKEYRGRWKERNVRDNNVIEEDSKKRNVPEKETSENLVIVEERKDVKVNPRGRNIKEKKVKKIKKKKKKKEMMYEDKKERSRIIESRERKKKDEGWWNRKW